MSMFRRKLLIAAALGQQGGGDDALPSGYTQLQWIENIAYEGACIKTPFKMSPNINVEVVLQPTSAKMMCAFGGRTSYSEENYSFWLNTDSQIDCNRAIFNGFTYQMSSKKPLINKKLKVVKDINHYFMSIDGEIVFDYTFRQDSGSDSKGDLILFCSSNSADIMYKFTIAGKMFSARVWDGNKELGNYIPCKSPTGVVGMYDLVGGQFYGSAISDKTFIAGPTM